MNVAPFKAQNMALNSFITKEGGEIGHVQEKKGLSPLDEAIRYGELREKAMDTWTGILKKISIWSLFLNFSEFYNMS